MRENLSVPAAGSADAIRALVVPQVAPPYDDEPQQGNDSRAIAASWPPASDGTGHGQGGGAAGILRPRPARPNTPGEPDPDSHGRGPGEHSRGPGEHSRGPAEHSSRPPGSRPPADTWPGQFAQILAETLAGSRPAHQLTRWTTEETRRRIRQLNHTLATGQRPRVRRVMTSAPASGVLELTAVVGFGPRVRVLAMRLERQQSGPGQWRCTAIESA